MGSLIDEERHLGNGDSSLLTPQKCKRQKVSAPREFSCEIGLNDGVVYKQTEGKGLQRNDELYVDGILKEVLKDIGSFGENGGDPQEAERRVLVEHMVQPGCLNGLELKASHLAGCGKVRLENEELKNLSVENPNDIMAKVKDKDQKMESNSAGASNRVKELLENSIPVTETERGVIVQCLMCPSSCPVRHQSNRKKRGYDAQDNQQRYLTRSKYKGEKLVEKTDLVIPNPKETETDEFSRTFAFRDDEATSEDKVKEPTELSPSRVSEKASKRKKHGSGARDNQQRYLTRSKCNAEKLAEETDLIIPNPKETERVEFSSPSALEDVEAYSEDKLKEPAELSPSRVSAKVSKRKKRGYGARENQQHYLTRSKCNAEKLAEKTDLIIPNPKETERVEFSPPSALRDVEAYSEDKLKEPAELSPSRVSAKVSKRKKRGYDARENQQRYLMRSKYNAEKLSEETGLIIPDPKETETDKFSRPLGLRNDEAGSEDKVKEPAQLSPSQVSAKVSKRKKRVYNAQDNQQRYLTRSKSSVEKVAEKSVLILPNPKETETDKVSQPLALGDDEDYCEDEVKGHRKLNPSPVSEKVSKGKKRDYDSQDNQQHYLTRSKYHAEDMEEKSAFKTPNPKEAESDEFYQPIASGDGEDCCEDEVKQPANINPSQGSASVSNGKKCVDGARENQQHYLTRSKCTAEKMGGISALIIPNPKEMEAEEFSQPVALGDKEDDCQDDGKLPAKLSPSRISTNIGKGMKCGYDAREMQQRYPTRSKYTAEKMGEKSALIVPNPKETEANEVCRPLALGDDEANCDNDMKRPAVLSPSGVSGNVGKGMNCGHDDQEKQQRYLTRSKCSVEKVAEKSVLVIPDPKGTDTNTVSRPLAFGDGEDYSEDEVTGSAKVSIGKRRDHDALGNQQLYLTRSKYNAEKLTEISMPNTKETQTGEISRSLALGDDKDYSKDEVKGPTNLSPSCVSGSLSKGTKPGFDARDNQQRYLTRSIYSAEKLAEKSFLIIPDPKESGINEVCQPIALGDDENYSAEHDSEFELFRMPGQYQLARKEVKQFKSCKVWDSRRVNDISKGKEKLPIGAVNTVDNEKPPSFTYITSTMYPDWCQPLPPKGCDCKGGCSGSKRCACAVKNGGDIPYNLRGAIVEAKPLVYECGPSCKCPPSCPNRVSQRGIKLPLEIFKTQSMGWGVRCRSSISSGSFICEYIGELLDDKEAEERVGSDEYLFDIGQNYNDTTLSDGSSDIMPDMPSIANKVVNNIGFTIDAAQYGNIGRFVNHSCSPNLYAQNVLYDHEDERIPHVMLFATENIPPLQELTYHYNYSIDQVFDSKGNIKKKSCYCGSDECTGRMY